MGKLVVSQFMSIDGVFEDPGGSEDQERGGWAFDFERGDEGDKFKMDELMAADVLLLGRKTYQGFAEAWPDRSGDPFSDKFNSMKKVVVSTTLTDPSWNNTDVVSDDVPGGIAKLKEETEGDILVNGSGVLVKTLVDHDLVDEYRLMVFPVVLGEGQRAFADTAATAKLELIDSKPAGETFILTYRPKS